MIERRRSAADLLELFERRALDPEKFPPDAAGRYLYDRYTRATFKAVLDDAAGRIRRSVYKRLQGPPIVIVSEQGFWVRPSGNDHQRLDRLTHPLAWF